MKSNLFKNDDYKKNRNEFFKKQDLYLKNRLIKLLTILKKRWV